MKKKKPKAKVSYRKYIMVIWIVFVSSILLFAAFMFSVSKGLFGKLPETKELENPETPLATEIYSADGVILGKFFNENRSFVSYDEISPHMYDALIATEDVRYREHSGIDFKSVLSIPYYLIRGKNKGASTITQQLAKNLFPRNIQNKRELVLRKFKEWIMAAQFERQYTKDEIINMYLNTVQFGSNAFGIKAASKTFFNKKPSELNVEESAVLVGLLKAITKYNPKLNPENSKDRRNVVLSQMMKYGYLSEPEFDSIEALPIKLDYQVESHNEGIARYFREYLRIDLKPWCEENGYDLYSDGLKIFTTIDSRMQKHAEQAAWEHLEELQQVFFKHWEGVHNPPFGWKMSKDDVTKLMHQAIRRTDRYRAYRDMEMEWEDILEEFNKPVETRLFSYSGTIDTTITPYDSIFYYKWFLNPGFMAMEPSTGQIKAWVGGIDYRYFKYDHVKSQRQVGSTFKPFVYATAVTNGYSPCLKVPDVPVTFPEFDNWQPRNSDGKYGDILSLEEGLARSKNCITAWIMKKVTPVPVIELAGALGIDTTDIDPYPSIALGTPDISVYEMVAAFNAFANKGVWVEPTYIARIEDKNGNVVKEFVPREVEVIDEPYNYVILRMLMNTSRIRNGTALRLRFRYNLKNEIAAKTGTTQNNSDGWFIGMVPQLSAGCWVGAEDRSVHFRSIRLGQGANMALPIWAKFMQKVYADSTLGIEPMPFEEPEEELPVEIDCSKYKQESDFGGFENGHKRTGF